MTALVQAIRTGSPRSLVAAFLFFDVSFMIWVLIGALGVHVAHDVGLTATQKGLAVGIPLLAGAGFRLVIGFLADRFGPKRVGLVTLGLLILPLTWGWLAARTFADLVVLGLGLGLAGASFAVALPLASRWYPPEHQGLAMGIAGAGNSGSILSILLAPLLAEQVGWHGVFGLALIPLGLTFLAFLILAQEPPLPSCPMTMTRGAALCRRPDLWWVVVWYSLTFGGFVGLSSFLTILLHDQYHVTATMAGGLAAVCVFAGSFFRPVGGYLADRMGGVRVLTVLSIILPCLFAGLSLTPSLGPAMGLLVVVMTGLGMGNGAIFQMVPQRFRDEIGIVSGVVGAAGGIGGFMLPSLLGLAKDGLGSYGPGLLVFGGMIVLAMYLPLRQSHRAFAWQAATGEISGLDDETQAGAFPAAPQVRMEVVFGG